MSVWIGRLGITVVITVVAIGYRRGQRQVAAGPTANRLFFAGLGLLLLALASPLHQLASQYFSMRVTQHLLLVAWIPALLMAANPLPQLLAGLPEGWREWLQGKRPFVEKIRPLTSRGATWIFFVSTFWIWYDPTIHQATLTYPLLRLLEVTLLLSAALLYWWHITAAYPQWHQPLPPLARAAYTLIGATPIKMVGLILLFNPKTAFSYPQTFHLSGLDINDYNVGSILIWVLGGIVYTATTTLLLRDWLQAEEDKPPLPISTWSSDEALAAPGFKK
jgi:cytochrome c oxidase assembly factor CtaG